METRSDAMPYQFRALVSLWRPKCYVPCYNANKRSNRFPFRQGKGASDDRRQVADCYGEQGERSGAPYPSGGPTRRRRPWRQGVLIFRRRFLRLRPPPQLWSRGRPSSLIWFHRFPSGFRVFLFLDLVGFFLFWSFFFPSAYAFFRRWSLGFGLVRSFPFRLNFRFGFVCFKRWIKLMENDWMSCKKCAFGFVK